MEKEIFISKTKIIKALDESNKMELDRGVFAAYGFLCGLLLGAIDSAETDARINTILEQHVAAVDALEKGFENENNK